MGLDCYVMVKTDTGESEELWYGRKENEIHGWMQRHSGIPAEDFNYVEFPLSADLLDQLEQDLHEGNLTYTSGFFFGGPGTEQEVLGAATELLTRSRQALAEDRDIFYFSWW